jgi:glycogen(starch) synthase
MRKAIAKVKPDVLNVICFGPNGVYATILSAFSRVPLVLSLQGETQMDDHDIFEHSTVMRRSLRASFKQAAAVTSCSNCTLDDAVDRFGLAAGIGVVLQNGVVLEEGGSGGGDPGSGGGPESEFGVPGSGDQQTLIAHDVEPHLPSGRYMVALGRVVRKKGFDLFLEAFAAISDKHQDVSLVIGGDGAALPELRKLAASLGIADRVWFPGRLSREHVATTMARSIALVVPSRYEPFGIVVLEGWRAGVPVLATSNGGPGEILESGKDGLLVDPLDTLAFSSVLDLLLSDDDLRNRLSEAGRRRVLDFDWKLIADRYVKVYSEAV